MNPPYDVDSHQHRDVDALTILTQAATQGNTNNNYSTINNNSNSTSNTSITTTGSIFSSNNSRPTSNSALTTRDSASYYSRAQPTPTSIATSMISNHLADTSDHQLSPNVAKLVGEYIGPRSGMENLMFNPSEQIPQSAYMNHPFQATYPTNLGILNAEKYNDGRGSVASHDPNMMSMKPHTQNPMPFGMLEKNGDSSEIISPSEEQSIGKGRRKRVRNDSPSLEDDEEARKKARGRPRVDTKDETAADRRRTQIRMAQRAYRHRKETTISSLENQVQELRGTTEEMNNIFINLYDFAISRGLLQREPEFGHQIQSATQRFLELAKQSISDDNSKDADESPENLTHESHSKTNISSTSHNTQHLPSPTSLPQEPIDTETVNSWGGYTVSRDTISDEERSTERSQQDTEHIRHSEVISKATEDNASFPFNSMDIQQYRVEMPSPPLINDFSQSFYPHALIPLPATHSYYELSFARRVHRATMEQGYRLLTMKDPPQERYREVFGYCMEYESKEESVARFRKALSCSVKEPLQEWRAPFVHLGGAGTYYPNQSRDTDNDLMPKFRTGFSMGPFSSAFTPVRESINPDMRCTIPGFEGEFFDPSDVEGYLKGHGFDLPPAADFITGQIDLQFSSNADIPGTAITDSRFPPTPRSPVGKILDETDQQAYNVDYSNGDMGKGVQTNDHVSFFIYPPWNTEISKEPNPFDITGPIFDSTVNPSSGNVSPMMNTNNKRYTQKRTVTIRVETLINELVSRACCLGRAPGYRRADVDTALINSAKEAGF